MHETFFLRIDKSPAMDPAEWFRNEWTTPIACKYGMFNRIKIISV